jgi:hypothetical protein
MPGVKPCSSARTCRSVRHPAREPGRARALHREGALRRRSRRRRRGGRRGHGVGGLPAHRRGVRAAGDDRRSAARRPQRPAEPRIHDYGVRGNIHKPRTSSSATSRRALPRPTTSARTRSSSRATRTCRWSSTRRSRSSTRRQAHVWSSTQTPHYLHRALAKVLQPCRRTHPRDRRPNGGGFGGKSDPFNHEIAPRRCRC